MKPRIRKSGSLWLCGIKGSGWSMAGYTPAGAFAEWCEEQRRRWRAGSF